MRRARETVFHDGDDRAEDQYLCGPRAIFSILGGWLGIVFSIIGLVQAPKFGGKGKGLAIAGLIISVIWVVIAIAMYPFVLAAMENALA